MANLTLWFMLLFVATGLLISGLSVPMMRRRVKPNVLYGFRTPKTLSSQRIWYEANAYAGKMLWHAGIVIALAAIALFFFLRDNFIAYNIACAVVQLGVLSIGVALSFRHLRSL